MPKKIEEMIHILCPTRAYLAAAKVMGPIVHPLIVTKKVAVQLLMSGAEVYEYIPKTKKTLKLTLTNINDPNRYTESGNVHDTAKTSLPVEPVIKMGVPNITHTPIEIADTEPIVESVEPPAEVVIEEPEKLIEFSYNEDGTVDETVIEWGKYSKNQRKDIRVMINEHNASIMQ